MRQLIPYAGKEPGSRSRGGSAAGYYERSPHPKISIRLPQDHFDRIVAMAERMGCSFAKAANKLIADSLQRRVDEPKQQ